MDPRYNLGVHSDFAVPVGRPSREWGWLEYFLMASCRTSRLRMRAAWSVANSRLAAEVEHRCKGVLQLYAWMPVSALPNSVSVQEVCQNGFRTAGLGTPFHVGNIRLPGLFRDTHDKTSRARGRTLPGGRRLYEFLLCRVGVGRAYTIEDLQQAQTLEIPPEYDSFFIRSVAAAQDETLMSEQVPGTLPPHSLNHQYVVKDPSQALPMYLVHFEVDTTLKEKLELPVCDDCGVRPAQLFCDADNAVFCEQCDARVHAANSIAARHVRVPINERPAAMVGQCPEHPDVQADEYCTVCQIPLCPQCRGLGHHSMGAAAQHYRIPLKTAYEKELKAGRRSTVLDYRLPVESQLSDMDRKLSRVHQSSQVTEDQLYEKVQFAMQQAQDLAEEQAGDLRADELEFQRQIEQSNWMESFMEECKSALPPADFLATWLQHLKAREESSEFTVGDQLHEYAGLRIEGTVRAASALDREKLYQELRAGGPDAFNIMDRNNDGVISRREFEQAAIARLEARGPDGRSPPRPVAEVQEPLPALPVPLHPFYL
mmetsp:Transcript_10186/g.22955  ORF Transcript_10186/g.22955 Transcript_10186/m.22955 type:complete len:541 (+) Transcript_10186:129-1751(+)